MLLGTEVQGFFSFCTRTTNAYSICSSDISHLEGTNQVKGDGTMSPSLRWSTELWAGSCAALAREMVQCTGKKAQRRNVSSDAQSFLFLTIQIVQHLPHTLPEAVTMCHNPSRVNESHMLKNLACSKSDWLTLDK